MNDYPELLNSTHALARELQGLQAVAVAQYTPVLHLYRRLCRHYFDIDPVATVSYINAYREWWDSDEVEP